MTKMLASRFAQFCFLSASPLALVVAAAPAAAQAPTRAFDIPAQPLSSAVLEFSRQADVMVVLPPELAAGKRSAAVKGSLSVNAAIAQLLRRTGLRAMPNAAGGYRVAPFAEGRGAARAEDSTASSGVVADSGEVTGDIIVTAQKKAERSLDVPISLVALGSSELTGRRLEGVDDLAATVPGLSVQSSGGYQRRIMLRGVSNTFGNASLIGMYIDEASVTSSPTTQIDARIFDLDRVEVLRGPQGTLYGEGSIGGTIRLITRDPQLDTTSFFGDVSAAFTDDGAPSQSVQAGVNLPLVVNTLGIRVVGTFDHQGGWIDQPAAGRQNYNDQDLVNVRAKLLWKPTPDLNATGMVIVHRNRSAPNNAEDENGNFTQSFNLSLTPGAEDKYDLYNLTVSYDLGMARLLSTSTYLDQDRQTYNLGFPQLNFTPPGAPKLDAFAPLIAARNKIFTQEVRATSNAGSPFQWTVGGYYRHAKIDSDTPFFYFDVPSPTGAPTLPTPFPIENVLKSKSWAVFGDASYDLTSRLTVGAGVRYFEDRQDYSDINAATSQSGTFRSTNPRFYVRYKVADDANLYASAARGFRSGGFNPVGQPSYGPETAWTYEVGSKLRLVDGRLRIEGALFYTDYKDYQIQGFLPPPAPLINIYSNAGTIHIKGSELSVIWKPTRTLTLTASGTYNHTEFVEINATSTSHIVGDPLDLTPKYSFTVSVQNDWSLGDRNGFARIDYVQQGRSVFRNRKLGPDYFDRSDVINTLNANLQLQWSDYLGVSLFATNLLNDRGNLDPYEIEANSSRVRPRTIGFALSFNM
jgi:iron complex outermembrane recepter protein